MGTLRLLLALTVLNWHYPIVPFNFIFSYSAVLIFFIISGFYMSMVITEKYGISRTGMLLFYENRALRLLPVYYIALLSCQLAGTFDIFGQGAGPAINQLLIFPHALWANATLQPYGRGALFLGQMYTVALEIIFYALAPLIVLRSLSDVWALFLLGAVANIGFWYSHADAGTWQYDFFPSILMYFLAGVLSYRLYTAVAKWRSAALIGYGVLPLIVLCGWLSPSAHKLIWVDDLRVFAFYAVCATAIPFLFAASKQSRLDRFIGDLSYPLYVAHVPAIWIVWATPWLGGAQNGGGAVLALSLLFSIGLTLLVDRPVEGLRHGLFARGRREADTGELRKLSELLMKQTNNIARAIAATVRLH